MAERKREKPGPRQKAESKEAKEAKATEAASSLRSLGRGRRSSLEAGSGIDTRSSHEIRKEQEARLEHARRRRGKARAERAEEESLAPSISLGPVTRLGAPGSVVPPSEVGEKSFEFGNRGPFELFDLSSEPTEAELFPPASSGGGGGGGGRFTARPPTRAPGARTATASGQQPPPPGATEAGRKRPKPDRDTPTEFSTLSRVSNPETERLMERIQRLEGEKDELEEKLHAGSSTGLAVATSQSETEVQRERADEAERKWGAATRLVEAMRVEATNTKRTSDAREAQRQADQIQELKQRQALIEDNRNLEARVRELVEDEQKNTTVSELAAAQTELKELKRLLAEEKAKRVTPPPPPPATPGSIPAVAHLEAKIAKLKEDHKNEMAAMQIQSTNDIAYRDARIDRLVKDAEDARKKRLAAETARQEMRVANQRLSTANAALEAKVAELSAQEHKSTSTSSGGGGGGEEEKYERERWLYFVHTLYGAALTRTDDGVSVKQAAAFMRANIRSTWTSSLDDNVITRRMHVEQMILAKAAVDAAEETYAVYSRGVTRAIFSYVPRFAPVFRSLFQYQPESSGKSAALARVRTMVNSEAEIRIVSEGGEINPIIIESAKGVMDLMISGLLDAIAASRSAAPSGGESWHEYVGKCTIATAIITGVAPRTPDVLDELIEIEPFQNPGSMDWVIKFTKVREKRVIGGRGRDDVTTRLANLVFTEQVVVALIEQLKTNPSTAKIDVELHVLRVLPVFIEPMPASDRIETEGVVVHYHTDASEEEKKKFSVGEKSIAYSATPAIKQMSYNEYVDLRDKLLEFEDYRKQASEALKRATESEKKAQESLLTLTDKWKVEEGKEEEKRGFLERTNAEIVAAFFYLVMTVYESARVIGPIVGRFMHALDLKSEIEVFNREIDYAQAVVSRGTPDDHSITRAGKWITVFTGNIAEMLQSLAAKVTFVGPRTATAETGPKFTAAGEDWHDYAVRTTRLCARISDSTIPEPPRKPKARKDEPELIKPPPPLASSSSSSTRQTMPSDEMRTVRDMQDAYRVRDIADVETGHTQGTKRVQKMLNLAFPGTKIRVEDGDEFLSLRDRVAIAFHESEAARSLYVWIQASMNHVYWRNAVNSGLKKIDKDLVKAASALASYDGSDIISTLLTLAVYVVDDDISNGIMELVYGAGVTYRIYHCTNDVVKSGVKERSLTLQLLRCAIQMFDLLVATSNIDNTIELLSQILVRREPEWWTINRGEKKTKAGGEEEKKRTSRSPWSPEFGVLGQECESPAVCAARMVTQKDSEIQSLSIVRSFPSIERE